MNDVPFDVKNAFLEAEKYFPSPLQMFQFFDKYSRFNYEKKRRETWIETVDRSMSFLKKLSKNKLEDSEYDRIRRFILEMKSSPSMRLLAMAGEAAERQNAALYNCSFLPIDSIDSIVESLIIAMAGTGVGFSVERKYVNNLPEVKNKVDYPNVGFKATLVKIQDSTEGWAEAFKIGLNSWFNGEDVFFDYSKIREAGAPLKIKGGRASGPEPLKKLLDFTKEKIQARQGKKLRPIDAHDIVCKVGEAIVSGGVRRTALISLFDIDDAEMRDCKNGENIVGNEQRYMANNSAVWGDDITDEEITKQMTEMKNGMRGEPGIFSRSNANKLAPERRKRFGNVDYGTNPCFAPGTLIHTSKGHFPIEELVGKNVDVWDGKNWIKINNFRVTAENQPILKIIMQDGGETRLTPYHTCITSDGLRVQVKDLRVGDRLMYSSAPESHGAIVEKGAYIKGFLMGDGTHHKENPILYLYNTKYSCEKRLIESAEEIRIEEKNRSAIEDVGFVNAGDNRKRMTGISVRKELLSWTMENKKRLPKSVFAWDISSKLELIAGIMDADGSASDTKNGWMYQIWSINKSWLLDFQVLLKTIGVQSKLSLAKKAGICNFNDGYGDYNSQESWRLTISQSASILLARQVKFSRLISFDKKETSYSLQSKENIIANITSDGIENKVYCCTVPISHSLALSNGLLYGQCGEINLRPYEFCNLSIAIAREYDTLETLKEKVEVATIIGTIQSMATRFPGLRDIWRKNCEEERLLGVDINGWVDCPVLRPNNQNLEENLKELRDHAVAINKEYSKILGINPSSSVTCVKPSGNSGILFNCASGIHGRWAPYYIRNVRIQAESPIRKIFEDQGVPMVPEIGQNKENANTYVASFPVKSPFGSLTKNDLTALQQCEYWLKAKLFWTEHNPSVTITYKMEEFDELLKWVLKHKEWIGGMSFLPSDDAQYDLMPNIEITEQEYIDKISEFPKIDFSKLYLYEKEDHTSASQELACTSGACSLDEYRAKQAAMSVGLT